MLKASLSNSSFVYHIDEGIKPGVEHRYSRHANTLCKPHQIIYNFLKATNLKSYCQCNGTV